MEEDLQIVATLLPPGVVQKGSTTLFDTNSILQDFDVEMR